jgi:hypothetical protein
MEKSENRTKIKNAIKEILQILNFPLAETAVMLKLHFLTEEEIEKSVAVIKKYF